MIEKVKGNLLEAKAEALVNTVNTVGVMGKGVALQFKKAFPENYKAYKKACDSGGVHPGCMFIHDLSRLQNPRYIINFPTKRHWRGKSRIEDIESGLQALIEDVRRLCIRSIALPPLGCGYGGLNWNDVFPMIQEAFEPLDSVRVFVYEPTGAPAPEKMKDRTDRPKMTIGRAVILELMNRYLVPGYNYLLSLLEIHKLAYFQQEAGEPLKLQFQKETYGPYADNIRHVLNRIENHFILGFGDGRNKPDTPIRLLSGAIEEAELVLARRPSTQERFNRVVRLIEGFETPYGMELLSSVHWVAQHDEPLASDVDSAITAVHDWNERKSRMFKSTHIQIAWQRLEDQGWLP